MFRYFQRGMSLNDRDWADHRGHGDRYERVSTQNRGAFACLSQGHLSSAISPVLRRRRTLRIDCEPVAQAPAMSDHAPPGTLQTLGSIAQRVDTGASARAGDALYLPAQAVPATASLPANNGVMHRVLAIPN